QPASERRAVAVCRRRRHPGCRHEADAPQLRQAAGHRARRARRAVDRGCRRGVGALGHLRDDRTAVGGLIPMTSSAVLATAEAAEREGRPPRPRRSAATRRDWIVGYTMIAPVVLGSVAFVIVPLIAVLWFSLHDWNVLANTFVFAGADNYERMLSDPGLRDSLLASLWFSIGLVVLNVTLALFLAVLLNQRLPGTTTFRTFFFSPVVVSLVAWTIVWSFLLQADGGINGFLSLLGVQGPNWLRGDFTAMLAVIIVQVFKNVGLNMILFLAALQGVPEEVQEAARIDGAGA